MALFDYIKKTQFLLADLKQQVVNPALLIYFINIARDQVAGEGECVRHYGSLSLVAAQRVYNFSSIGVGSGNGIAGPFNVRMMTYGVGTGQQFVHPRSWEWFNLYRLNNPVPPSGAPTEWCQYAQGTSGTIYVDPLPDQGYTLSLDTTCQPIELVDDTTVEAIPYPWTDAVPFFAAYFAYLSVQEPDKAAGMLKMHEEFMRRARAMSNPSVSPYVYPQSGNPTRQNQLGVQPADKRGSG